MPEQKTFKNPELDYCVIQDHWNEEPEWGWEINDETYSEKEWDVVVTLTRKERPILIGDLITFRWDGRRDQHKVLATHEDYVWALNVSRPEDSKPYVVEVDDVIRD